VLDVTHAHQLEGIVAKRVAAPYEPGRRGGAWLKHKHRRQETFRRHRLAARRPPRIPPDAIFVARTTPDGDLRPAGSAELGLSAEERERLRAALQQRHVETRRGAHRVAAGIWVDADFHDGEMGPRPDHGRMPDHASRDPTAAPRCLGGNAVTITANAHGVSSAPNTPWSTRPATSTSMLGASAHTIEDPPKPSTPIDNTRRSPNTPPKSSTGRTLVR
jgi:hypothetical protein